jgi:hypothetical protein
VRIDSTFDYSDDPDESRRKEMAADRESKREERALEREARRRRRTDGEDG